MTGLRPGFVVTTTLLCLAGVLLLSACAAATAPPATPPPSPEPTVTPAPSPEPTATPLAAQPEWQLVWNDEFEGDSLDRSRWVFDLGGSGWGNNELQFYTDRPENARVADGMWVFDHPFFLLLNVAVGGNWPGNPDDTTTFPQTLLVDYVRVYQEP